MAKSALLALCLCALLACGSGDEFVAPAVDAGADATAPAGFDLILELNGYGMAHDGDTLYFALWNDADESAPKANVTHLIESGNGGGGGGNRNDIRLAGALEEGHSYTLFWYADIDGNESCDAATDHHWSVAISNVVEAVSMPHRHSTTFNGDCAKH